MKLFIALLLVCMLARHSAVRLRETNAIPRIMHYIYIDEDTNSNSEGVNRTDFQNNLKSCQDLHPSWEFMMWDAASADHFVSIHFHHLLTVYRRYPKAIYRADALRYMLLDHFGGLYLDYDMACYKAVDPYLETHGSPLDLILQMGNTNQGIHNGVIAGAPGHPFFKICQRVLRARAPTEFTFPDEMSPLHATGPELTDKALVLFSPKMRDEGPDEWHGFHRQGDHLFAIFKMGCWFIPCWWEDRDCQAAMHVRHQNNTLPDCVVGNHFSKGSWWWW